MSEWKSLRIDQIGTLKSGATPDTTNDKFWAGKIGWITPSDLSKLKSRFIYQSERGITKKGLESCSASLMPGGRSIVISSRAPIGYIAIPTTDFTTNQGCKSIVLGDDQDPSFHYYNLSHNVDKIKGRGEGTTFAEISKAELEKLKFNVPRLPIQLKIARILSTIDGQIEKTEAIIAKYQAVKQGMLQDLFTRGIDVNTGQVRPHPADAPDLYKPSPLGMIPKEWEVRQLGQLTEKIGSGVTPTGGSEVYKKEGILFIRSQNVLDSQLLLDDVAFISEKIDEQMASSRLRPYDVLLNITGASIGRCAYFPTHLVTGNVNQHVCIIRFNHISEDLALMASVFMNSDFGQSQIFKLNAGGNREGLNFQQIRSFYFPHISKTEIGKIASLLRSKMGLINKEKQTLAKLQLLKQGLMQDLLSGNVPVTV